MALILTSCQKDPNVAYIQGIWSHEDMHLAPIVGEEHLITRWIFDRGTFANDACCFLGETSLVGSYRVMESDENSLTLELYNIDGYQGPNPISNDAVTSLKITFQDDGTITIGRAAGFIRISDGIGD
jgi:hypothetical protein